MAGDGKFQWYWSLGQEPESYRGPCDTKEQAIAEATAEDSEKEGFTICEADKSVPSTNIFRADRVLEDYGEHNTECWGDDGADVEATSEQQNDLEKSLSDALDAWFKRHNLSQRGWRFGESRSEQYFPPKDEAAA